VTAPAAIAASPARGSRVKTLIAAALLALGALWLFMPGKANFRGFDAPRLGRAEGDLWRLYYERKYIQLGAGLILAENRSFGLSPWDSARSGISAALAARTFQNSRSRAEAQKALPELTKHFAIVAHATHSDFDPAQAAKLELEWWQLRRENIGPKGYAPAIAAATACLYNVEPRRLLPYAALRAQAMHLRDLRGDQITAKDWDTIGALLERAYIALEAEVSTQAPAA
jgi:hypothetical protein